MKVKVSEKTIEQQILIFLWSRRILCTKIDSTGIFDPKKKVFRKPRNKYKRLGVSDIYAQYKGIPIWIEVKSEDGRLSKHQIEWLSDVKAHGGIAIVARSVDDVERVLAEIDQSTQAG